VIAVCIPSFNLPDVTRAAVESVRAQSADWPVRLYLLDNGSSDRRVGAYLRSVPGDTVAMRSESRWVYGGWNTLLSRAMADGPEVLCLMNNDVRVGPRWLDPVVRELRAGGRRYFLPNGDFRNPRTFEADAARFLGDRTAEPRTVRGRAGWCLFFGPGAVGAFLPIPTTLRLWYGDDWVHWKLRAAGYSCEVVLECCVLHLGSRTLNRMDQAEKVRIVAEDRAEYERLTGERL
jgi:GT2 family glycosyltransferase